MPVLSPRHCEEHQRRSNPFFIFWIASLTLAMTFLFVLPAQAQDITTGLVAHWKMDEGYGQSVADSTGPNTGTFLGAPSITPGLGRVGNAIYFDGGDDEVDAGNNAVLNITDNTGTYAAWLRKEVGSQTGTIIYRGIDGSNGFQFSIGSSGCTSTQITFSKFNVQHLCLDGVPADTNWHHYAVVLTASGMYLYVDGRQTALNSDSQNVISSTENAYIGGGFNGYIDDVRVYDRALTPQDISALYGNAEGKIRYNTDSRVPEYFNGTTWVSMGESLYIPSAVGFPNSTYLTRTSNFTGVADGNTVTGSFWFKRYGNFGTRQFIFVSNNTTTTSDTNNRFRIEFPTNNTLRITGRSTTGLALEAASNTAFTDRNWHHVLFSFDTANAGSRYLYIDGVSSLAASPTTHTTANGSIDFSLGTPRNSVGARHAGTLPFDGYLSEFWLDIGRYEDISVAATRRKFTEANGQPVYLGPDGSKPFGAAPDVFLSGPTSTWETNDGTGGGFTENNALIDGMVSGRPGHPNASACSGLGDGRFTDPETGHCYYYTSTTADWSTAQTACQSNNGYLAVISNANEQGVLEEALPFNNHWISANDIAVNGEWRWVAGELEGQQFWQGDSTGSPVNNLFSLWNAGEPNDFGGPASENCATTYYYGVWNDSDCNAAERSLCEIPVSCTNPRRAQGTILYNDTENVMQYCDGEIWRPMGLVPGAGGAGCSNPTRAEGTLIYNSTEKVMQYCDGANWRMIGRKIIAPTSGLVLHWPLDETSGSTITDASGNGNNGTWNEPGADDVSGETVGGKVGTALDFSTSKYVLQSAFTLPAEGTFSAWVQSDFPEAVNPSSSFPILWYTTDTPSGTASFMYNTSSEFYTLRTNDISDRTTYPPPGDLTTWFHVVVTWSANGSQIYKDGVAIGTAGTGDHRSYAPAGFYLASRPGIDREWDGRIDDVRIYNRPLSPPEVQNLYYATGGQ